MSEYLNHTCAICGTKYHACDSCDTDKFIAWRSIVDTIEHYKIFLIIRDYTNKHIDINEAQKLLNQRDLNDLDNFVEEIKNVINNVLLYKDVATTVNKKKTSKIVNSEEKIYRETSHIIH